MTETPDQTGSDASLEAARAAKAQAHQTFAKIASVAGVGLTRIGAGYGLKINLQNPPDEGVELPDNISGVPVRVEVVGTIRKQA